MNKSEDMHKDVQIQVRVPKEIRDQFREIVENKSQTQAKVIRKLIERYINDNK